jgi:hypothetical protein
MRLYSGHMRLDLTFCGDGFAVTSARGIVSRRAAERGLKPLCHIGQALVCRRGRARF